MRVPELSRELTSSRACLLVFLIWAGIYLPALGSVELKHEEPRRALPAVRMLQTGDWLVPRIGAEAYLRKPPLLNWLIAISFRATGGRSELAARLPSVLAMLALALTVAVTGRGWLGPRGAFLAAIIVLTNLAAMETGRLAELEALYLSLTGIALMLWMTAWRQRANAWQLWCAPAPFLALGMLTKGPAHLLFFYAVVVAVLVIGKDLRTLRHPAHGLALALTLGPFLAWAIPCAAAVTAATTTISRVGRPTGAWGFWSREITSRVAMPPASSFPLVDWLLRVPQGFANFLPWTVFLPLLWTPAVRARFADAGERGNALFRGARFAMVATFLAVSLLPGGSARYVYPLIVIPSVLLACVLGAKGSGDDAFSPRWVLDAWRGVNMILFAAVACAALATPFFAVPGANLWTLVAEASAIVLLVAAIGWWRFRDPPRVLPLAMKSAAGMMLITAIYAFAAVPRLNNPHSKHPRETAASIRGAMRAGKTLGILDDGYHAFWYYLEPGIIYFHRLADVRSIGGIDSFLVPAKLVDGFIEDAGRQGLALAPVLKTSDEERHVFVLLSRPSASDMKARTLAPY